MNSILNKGGLLLIYVILCGCIAPAETAADPPRRILILGNSITVHPPSKALGWNGNWGMAASEQSKDYVHLLEASFKNKYGNISLKYGGIVGAFEARYDKIDTSDFSEYKNFAPDLIILRVGDNIQSAAFSSQALCKAFAQTIQSLKSKNPGAVVCVTSRFWYHKQIDAAIRQCAVSNQWIYVDISAIATDSSNTAIHEFKHRGVGLHPSDKGMQAIKDSIWMAVKDL